jgi:precorrin-8X/cobalt-precorrin-8 methylmutase
VIGNAPTALFKIKELIDKKILNPDFVVGVPVGFVGAKESKELIQTINFPVITINGNKGGSTVAAAIINALLYLIIKR